MNEIRANDRAGRALSKRRAGLAGLASRQVISSALVVLLALPLLWSSLVAAPRLRVDVGVWGDHTFLSGINGAEQSANEDFRWTTGRTELALPNLSARYRLLIPGAAESLVTLPPIGEFWRAWKKQGAKRCAR